MSIVRSRPRIPGPHSVSSQLPSQSLWQICSLSWTLLHNLIFCQVPIGFLDSNHWKPISSIFKQFACFYSRASCLHPRLALLHAPHLQTYSALFELVHFSFSLPPPLILSFTASKSKRYKMAKFSCVCMAGGGGGHPNHLERSWRFVMTEETTKERELHLRLKWASVFVCLYLCVFLRFLWTAFVLTRQRHLPKLVPV